VGNIREKIGPIVKDLKDLLNLMFEPEDEVCVSNSQWAYHSLPQSTVLSGDIPLVSPNKKVPTQRVAAEDLTLLCINSVLGFRKDDNVQSCRTFLWEADVGSLSSQIQYTKALKLPTSLAVFSGNKSVHFATVLEEPVDIKTYRLLYQWALNIGTLYDQNCKNPSRCIRIPGAIRSDTGKVQQLINLGSRIKLDEFMSYLNKYEHLRPKEREERKGLTSERDYDKLSEWCRCQFKDGIDFSKGRNKAFFALSCDLAKSGYTELEAEEILEQYFVEEHDFKYKEFLITIKSAFTYIINKG
jgi:hypothetical protein